MRKSFQESIFLIVGLARNCEKVIESEVKRLNKVFNQAKSIRWLIIESDSSDNTLQKLKGLQNQIDLRIISLGNLRFSSPKRTERIAICRNRYLEEISNNSEYDNVDYLVVADLDGVNTKLTQESVRSCWSLDIDWDACFANQSGPYYDIWALRHHIWSPNDCFANAKFLINNGISHSKAYFASTYSRMIKIKRTHPPIKVDSAFGGFGVYKKQIVGNARYIGLDNDGEEVCEHVQFHSQIKSKGAELYVVPSLINCGWNEHSVNVRLMNKIKNTTIRFLLHIVTKVISKQKLKRLLNR